MKAERDAAAVRVFPPLIPLLAILLGVALNKFLPVDFGLSLPAPARYWIGGILAVGALLCLGGWSVLLLRRDGQSENPWKPTFRIVNKGPFRISRNPMYLQMVVVCLGMAVALANVWLLLLTPVCAALLYVLAIRPEEAYLAAKLGEEYLNYKKSTRRWV